MFKSPTGPEFSIENVKKALSLYSKTRQPHAARILRIVHKQIEQRASAVGSFEEEDRKPFARMRNRPDTKWLSEHDVEAVLKAVLEQSKLEGMSRSKGSIGGAIRLEKTKF